MDVAIIAPAFIAGALAAFSPCGFIMLPALVAVQVREAAATDGAPGMAPVARALRFGLAATVGFIVVFGLLGIALALGARAIAGVFPLAALFVGFVLLGLGLLGLSGRHPVRLAVAAGPRFGRPITGGLPFGVAYAVASLSCTLPLFLALVGGTLVAQGLAAAFVPFLGYALGMGAVLIGVALAAALSAGAFLGPLRAISRHVDELGSIALTAVGGYLVLYWLPRLLDGT